MNLEVIRAATLHNCRGPITIFHVNGTPGVSFSIEYSVNGDSQSCTIEVVIEINLYSLNHSFFTCGIRRLNSVNSGYFKHWKMNQSPVLVNPSSVNDPLNRKIVKLSLSRALFQEKCMTSCVDCLQAKLFGMYFRCLNWTNCCGNLKVPCIQGLH